MDYGIIKEGNNALMTWSGNRAFVLEGVRRWNAETDKNPSRCRVYAAEITDVKNRYSFRIVQRLA